MKLDFRVKTFKHKSLHFILNFNQISFSKSSSLKITSEKLTLKRHKSLYKRMFEFTFVRG